MSMFFFSRLKGAEIDGIEKSARTWEFLAVTHKSTGITANGVFETCAQRHASTIENAMQRRDKGILLFDEKADPAYQVLENGIHPFVLGFCSGSCRWSRRSMGTGYPAYFRGINTVRGMEQRRLYPYQPVAGR